MSRSNDIAIRMLCSFILGSVKKLKERDVVKFKYHHVTQKNTEIQSCDEYMYGRNIGEGTLPWAIFEFFETTRRNLEKLK